MKRKKTTCILLALCLAMLFGLANAALAAEPIGLAFDGVRLPEYSADNITPFYIDAAPENKNSSVFVPVRVVSELLGAEVNWQNPNIDILYGDTAIRLTIGSQTAQKGEQTITLRAKPYVKDGRTYVPIRFVAEAFDCQVDWANNEVNVHSKPWQLNGKNVVGMASKVEMIADVFRYELRSPLFAAKMYDALFNDLGAEVPAPEHYGRDDIMDFANFYYQQSNNIIIADDGTEVLAFEIYECADNGFGQPLPQGYTEHLLLMEGKWYAVSDQAYDLFMAWNLLGRWEEC